MKEIYDIDDLDINYLLRQINKVFGRSSDYDVIKSKLNKIATSQITPFEKYQEILTELNQYQKNINNKLHETMHKSLKHIIAKALHDTYETSFNISDEHTQIFIDKALEHLKQQTIFEKDCYDSLAHQYFCKKWKVSGELSDYSIWHEIAPKLKYNLDQNNYAIIPCEIQLRFGKNIKSTLVDSDDKNYDQFGNITSSGAEQHYPKINQRTEMEIWKAENIVKLLIQYIKAYAQDNNYNISSIESKIISVRNKVLHPLLNIFEEDSAEITRQFNQFQNLTQQLLITYSKDEEKNDSYQKTNLFKSVSSNRTPIKEVEKKASLHKSVS